LAWAKKTIENTAKVAAGRFASANRKDGLGERVWRGTTLLVFSWFFERGWTALFGLDFFVLFDQAKRTKEIQSFKEENRTDAGGINCMFS
jgi:hypothetical protein